METVNSLFLKKWHVVSAIAAAVVLVGLPTVAQAHLIDLTPGGFGVASVIGNPADEADFIENFVGLDFDLLYLEKFDNGTGFDGLGAAPDSGIANYSVDTASLLAQDIEWDLTGSGHEALFVLAKNGKAGGPNGDFLYHLYGVSPDQRTIGGPDTVSINGAKDISHISWFGGPSTADVPDGGATCILLGSSLLGMAGFRRLIGFRKG